jgi:hypothetical protein
MKLNSVFKWISNHLFFAPASRLSLLFYFIFIFPGFGDLLTNDTLSKVKSYKKHISLAPNLTRIDLNSTLQNQQTKSKIDYRTATATRLGLALDYRWIGIELFTRLPFNEKIEKGTTNNTGIYLRVNKSKFWANGIFQKFNGFYWNNPDEITRSELAPGLYPLRPDLKSIFLQVNAYYIFRPDRFSNMAAQGENEMQLKSGGTFFTGLGFYFDRLNSSNPIVPESQKHNFKGQERLNQITTRSFALSGGYAHTFVIFKKFYTAFYLAPGFAIFSGSQRYIEGKSESLKGQITLRLDMRISLGYNSDTYFGGLLLSNSSNNQNLGVGTSYSYGFSTVRIFFGRRIFLKKQLGFWGL